VRVVCGSGPVHRPLLAFVPVMGGLPNLTLPLERHVGNAVSGYLLALPVDEPDPLRQLERIRRQTSAAKRAHVAIVAGFLARAALQLLPRLAFPWCVRLCADFVSACGVSSLRGPKDDQLGAWGSHTSVESVYFYGAFSPPRMPLMVGCCSIADRVRLTLALKTARVGESADSLLQHIPEALRELRAKLD